MAQIRFFEHEVHVITASVAAYNDQIANKIHFFAAFLDQLNHAITLTDFLCSS
jgi:hypothetical protein